MKGNTLDFLKSGWGDDFESIQCWPEDWPKNIEFEDGSMDYVDPFVKLKAYDTKHQLDERERDFLARGFPFYCEVQLCYYTTGLYCEDILARFPARDEREAKQLLQCASDALYCFDCGL